MSKKVHVIRAAALWVLVCASVPCHAAMPACPLDAPDGFSGTCDLPLRNGDFIDVHNVSNTRAIVWGHSAHWKASHPRTNLGIQHDGRWASQLFARGHSIQQDMPVLPVAGLESSRLSVRFEVSAPGNDAVRMRGFVQLRDANGQVLAGRSVAVSPSGAAWQGHEVVLPVTEVPAGARVQVAFVRDDDAGGKPVLITGVRAWQWVGE